MGTAGEQLHIPSIKEHNQSKCTVPYLSCALFREFTGFVSQIRLGELSVH